MTRRVLALGGHGITFQNGRVTPETFRAAVEVAHAAGKPVGIRAGLNIDAKHAALMGADFIPRSNGVGATIWRRFEVPASYNFWDLHVAIQDVMGWQDYHLHEFRLQGLENGAPVLVVARGLDPDDAHVRPRLRLAL